MPFTVLNITRSNTVCLDNRSVSGALEQHCLHKYINTYNHLYIKYINTLNSIIALIKTVNI